MVKNNEIWKDINGFPGYQISDRGKVRCFKDFKGNITDKFRILTPLLNKDNYYYVDLYTAQHKQVHKRIHRLVADAFLGKNDDLVVNHIDGNKHNNILSNIEFVTAKQNSTLAAEAGLYKTKPVRIVETGEIFNSMKECANAINVHPSCISGCLSVNAKKQDSSGGYHFEYVNELKKKTPFLYDHQKDAVTRMFNGSILNGGVGTGKSRTGLYYYCKKQGGDMDPYVPMKNPKDLYIITTAQKRDKHEWEQELLPFYLTPNEEKNIWYKNKVVVDSWNNIPKYVNVKNAFFIFDEDRVTGNGVWVKSFYKIAKSNDWIILSATAGDTWEDYIPVFIANGFYRNKTEFTREHIVYSRFTKYPKIDHYINTGRLIRLRNKILIDMDVAKHTVPHHEDVFVQYDISMYKDAIRNRWDPYKNEPIQQAAGLCYVLRKIVNSDESRAVALLEIMEVRKRIIVFYNFDYELDILMNLAYGEGVEVAQWNGHKHQPVPDSDRWVYLVQYTAGCEGWNCIKTDTIVFYSQTYSYKTLEQASGRIDRLNTPYIDLYYYHLRTRSGIDLAIHKALTDKKKFNEGKFIKW